MKLLSPKIDYRRRDKRGPWKYVLTSDVIYDLGFDAGIGEARKTNKRLIASWDGNILTIYAGYAWDGMTFWFDTEANKKKSLPHDVLYQLSNCWNNPFTKVEADNFIYNLEGCSIVKRIELFGVQNFGKLFWQFGRSDCAITIHKERP